MDLIANNTIDFQLPFQIQIAPGVSVTPSWHIAGHGPNVTANVTQCNSTNGHTITVVKQLGLSNGTVAGITIALFFIGIIVGIVLQLCVGCLIRSCRSRNGSLRFRLLTNKYKRVEEDDISLN